MGAQLPGVAGEVASAVGIVVGPGGVEVGVERHLGVDHDLPVAGQVHHEVGAQRAVVEPHLLGEVAALDQPGELDRAAQVDLTPPTAHLRLAQRGGERLGLAAQRLARHPHVEHLFVELPLPARPLVVDLAQLVAQPVEALHHLGLVDHALPDRVDVVGPRPHPQRAAEHAQREADHQAGQQDQDLHAIEHEGDHRQSSSHPSHAPQDSPADRGSLHLSGLECPSGTGITG